MYTVGQVDLVLNLGAGLDTRPYRLPLPPSLDWIEVDLPDLNADKAHKLHLHRPTCRLQRVNLDLANIAQRQELFSQVNETAKHALVITEGLLGYLSEGQVAQLSHHLRQQKNLRWWLLELSSPLLLQQWQRSYESKIYNDYFNKGRPAFQFAPEQGTEFFRTSAWEVAEVRSLWTAAQQLKRISIFLKILTPYCRWLAPHYWKAVTQNSNIVLLEQSNHQPWADSSPLSNAQAGLNTAAKCSEPPSVRNFTDERQCSYPTFRRFASALTNFRHPGLLRNIFSAANRNLSQ